MDSGDISQMLNLKKKLKCKPFKFFMEEVAPGGRLNFLIDLVENSKQIALFLPDILDYYPLVDPPAFASGGVRHNFH